MRPFHPSLRGDVTRLTLLALTSWLLLRVGLQLDVRAATVMTAGALGVMVAVRIGLRRRQTALSLDDGALRLAGPDGTRAIPWSAVEHVRLAAGDLPTPRGPVRVYYAHVEVARGPALAFADLSSLGDARVRLADDAPVHDVGDPELLLGALAERLDAREFLPARDATPLPPRPARTWLAASPLTTARLGVAALLATRAAAALWGGGDALTAALAGAAAVAAPHALVRFFAQRRGGATQSEVGAPPALAAHCLAAVALAFPLRSLATPHAGAWALAAALALALPAWPLPGGLVARRLGRHLASRGDRAAALAVAALAVLVAWLYAKGMVLVPTALVAGALEAAEGHAASRRHERLAGLPRFSQWPPEALARLRGLLRPVRDGEAQARALDLDAMRRAAAAPPTGWLGVALALAAVVVAGAAARVALHGPDAAAAHAIRWLLS